MALCRHSQRAVAGRTPQLGPLLAPAAPSPARRGAVRAAVVAPGRAPQLIAGATPALLRASHVARSIKQQVLGGWGRSSCRRRSSQLACARSPRIESARPPPRCGRSWATPSTPSTGRGRRGAAGATRTCRCRRNPLLEPSAPPACEPRAPARHAPLVPPFPAPPGARARPSPPHPAPSPSPLFLIAAGWMPSTSCTTQRRGPLPSAKSNLGGAPERDAEGRHGRLAETPNPTARPAGQREPPWSRAARPGAALRPNPCLAACVRVPPGPLVPISPDPGRPGGGPGGRLCHGGGE
jgi:hypothetical protein